MIAVTSVAANLSTIVAGLAEFVGAALIPAPLRAGEALQESAAASERPTGSPA